MASDPRHRSIVSKVRRKLLDAISFYQNALSQLKRSNSPPVDELLEKSVAWRNEFRHHDQLGWPGSLSALADEAEHLADRFDAEASAGRAPRTSRRQVPAKTDPDTGRYCA